MNTQWILQHSTLPVVYILVCQPEFLVVRGRRTSLGSLASIILLMWPYHFKPLFDLMHNNFTNFHHSLYVTTLSHLYLPTALRQKTTEIWFYVFSSVPLPPCSLRQIPFISRLVLLKYLFNMPILLTVLKFFPFPVLSPDNKNYPHQRLIRGKWRDLSPLSHFCDVTPPLAVTSYPHPRK